MLQSDSHERTLILRVLNISSYVIILSHFLLIHLATKYLSLKNTYTNHNLTNIRNQIDTFLILVGSNFAFYLRDLWMKSHLWMSSWGHFKRDSRIRNLILNRSKQPFFFLSPTKQVFENTFNSSLNFNECFILYDVWR